jgi:hypothetical protein
LVNNKIGIIIKDWQGVLMGRNSQRLHKYFSLFNRLTLNPFQQKSKPTGWFPFFKGTLKPNYYFGRKLKVKILREKKEPIVDPPKDEYDT